MSLKTKVSLIISRIKVLYYKTRLHFTRFGIGNQSLEIKLIKKILDIEGNPIQGKPTPLVVEKLCDVVPPLTRLAMEQEMHLEKNRVYDTAHNS